MTKSDFAVYLVDDDPGVLTALSRLLRMEGYETRAFTTPDMFLAEHDPASPGCVVVDLAMPTCDGLALQKRLADIASDRPVIFLTGHGTVSDSVRAMRAGAIDFLLKPVQRDDLLHAIERAAEKDLCARRLRIEKNRIFALLATLTRRESEVLRHVIAGRISKQIAFDLHTVEKTIKVHRSRMMAKMGVRTVADLVRLTQQAGVLPASP